ncbi:MAG: hypothetical protein K6D91_09885 [Prevotella sp.]|nr:hypothetical protein [Prevotella sp.]
MKQFSCTIILFLCFGLTVMAGQQSWTKKLSKAVFTLKTFSADGELLGSTSGFFVGEHGEAVSSYAPFKSAAKAVVIDEAGKEWDVEKILGANETYDVIKFRVAIKKSQSVELATVNPTVNTNCWVLPYKGAKSLVQTTILKTEKFNTDYTYFTMSLRSSLDLVGCPLVDETGKVLGLIQPKNSEGDTLAYAVGAPFAEQLKMTGLSLNDPALRAVHIKKAIPEDLNQAQLMLLIAASQDSLTCTTIISDFLSQFPKEPDGYVSRAQQSYSYGRYDEALQDINKAYELSPQPNYLYQKGTILFAQDKYAEAYDLYQSLFDSPVRSAELFYMASQCKAKQNDSIAQQALLDSCVAQFSRPLLKEVAPYLLVRAEVRLNAKRYRDAVVDLNDYEQLMKTQLNDNFYYIRYQAEVGGRLFQQALNDIEKAIELAPQNEFYYAEKALLLVRVGMYDEAITTSKTLVQMQPTYSDGYLFLGLSQCLKGDKAEGIANLQKAKELGDTQAEGFIQKYQ